MNLFEPFMCENLSGSVWVLISGELKHCLSLCTQRRKQIMLLLWKPWGSWRTNALRFSSIPIFFFYVTVSTAVIADGRSCDTFHRTSFTGTRGTAESSLTACLTHSPDLIWVVCVSSFLWRGLSLPLYESDTRICQRRPWRKTVSIQWHKEK